MNFQETISVVATESAYIVLPEKLNSLPISLCVTPGLGATASIEVSCDDFNLLNSNPSDADFVLVEDNITVGKVIAVSTPITAVKLTSAGAASTLSVRAFDIEHVNRHI